VEKNRAEQNAAWKARLDELAVEVDDARAEEESRLLDLPDFKEDDNQEEFKPKKAHRVRDWVRSHLQCRLYESESFHLCRFSLRRNQTRYEDFFGE